MARDRTRIRQQPLLAFGVPIHGGALIPTVGQDWFVDPNADVFVPKKAWGTGKSDDRPFRTLEEALAACNTADRIFIHGNVREEGLIASNLKFDVQVIGVGGRHHPDQPTAAYHPGAACIRPPASPTAATPLINLRGRGWQFQNILFDTPVDAAAVALRRNALSGASEYDASHAIFRECDFRNGLYGIEDDGGCYNVRVYDCDFETLDATSSGTGIICTSTSVALPRRWHLWRNRFAMDHTVEGNERHIVAAAAGWYLEENMFGRVKDTGTYIDFTGGQDNVVTRMNYLSGAYNTSNYVPGTNDEWRGNIADDAEAEVGDNGWTVANPTS
jgi:hypothetical protein